MIGPTDCDPRHPVYRVNRYGHLPSLTWAFPLTSSSPWFFDTTFPSLLPIFHLKDDTRGQHHSIHCADQSEWPHSSYLQPNHSPSRIFVSSLTSDGLVFLAASDFR
ncbi:hypothetical protein PM082_022402 [Marasmius tenuissimus]|nr:hypothetical protein PM082_022402 [Marasmius tenuissimus]